MKLQDLIISSPISAALKSQLLDFDLLCSELSQMTEVENESLFSSIQGESLYSYEGKLALLHKFESRIKLICDLLEVEAFYDTKLLNYIYENIENLECKIKVNTSLHMHNYKQMSNQTAGQEAFSPCH
tara:strand:+ start:2738 stop:3121 length:384 start_codon:yes stop_codon:yes gene_type:complete